MSVLNRIVATAAIAVVMTGLAGCEREGPAERTGKKVDQSIERAGEKVERAGEKIQDAASDAKK
jgi:hypothetical protein